MSAVVESFERLPESMQVTIGILLAVQLILAVIALIRLARTDQARIAGLPRPAWVVVIVLGQMLGPILFLVLERRDRAAHEGRGDVDARPATATASDAGADLGVVDRLYGDRR